MQEPGLGITNSSQGNFDFSKREFDFNAGLAWNYFDRLELRASAYSAGNLNRGLSLTSPSGFKDGVLLEIDTILGLPMCMTSAVSTS